jgi:hypothetical protein
VELAGPEGQARWTPAQAQPADSIEVQHPFSS